MAKATPNKKRAPNTRFFTSPHGRNLKSRLRRLANLQPVSFANCNDGNKNYILINPVDQSIPHSQQLDLVTVWHSCKGGRRNAWSFKARLQLFLEGFTYAVVEVLPFCQRQFMKTKLIAHPG